MNSQKDNNPKRSLPGRNNNPSNAVTPEQISNSYENINDNWWGIAECKDRDPNIFFPSDGVGVEIAKKICAECIVKSQCLDYAIDNRIDHGVWGGTSERERRKIIKSRKIENPSLP